MRRYWIPAGLLALATTLTGCVDLPVDGNVGEKIKPMLPDSLRERLFGADSGVKGAKVAPVRNLRRNRLRRQTTAAAAEQEQDGAEEPDAVPAIPKQDVAVLYEQYLTRNMEFDHLRTKGLEQLYAGQTDKAIESFKAALAKKPGDKSVEDLLQLAENPPMRALDGGAPPVGFPAGIPGLPTRLPPS